MVSFAGQVLPCMHAARGVAWFAGEECRRVVAGRLLVTNGTHSQKGPKATLRWTITVFCQINWGSGLDRCYVVGDMETDARFVCMALRWLLQGELGGVDSDWGIKDTY